MPLPLILEPFKAGSTFDYDGPAELPEGVWQGRSQLRDKKTGALVAELLVEVGERDEDGICPLSVSSGAQSTRSWGAAKGSRLCVLDIQFTSDAGLVATTETIEVSIIPAVTKATT